jgi:LPS sulfotransferase NodH
MLGFMDTLPSIPMGKVIKSYVVCATPRSGGTLVCALLAGTGAAGRPEEYFERLWRTGAPRQPREYFAGVEDPDVLALLAPTQPGEADRSDPFPSALEHVGAGAAEIPAPPLRRQGDDRSARWVERFRGEHAAV